MNHLVDNISSSSVYPVVEDHHDQQGQVEGADSGI